MHRIHHRFEFVAVVSLILFMSLTVESVVGQEGDRRQPRQQFPSGLDEYAYADTDNPRQTLNLVLPQRRASDEPLPVVVFIHGGAWRGGDKRIGLSRIQRYVNTGQFAGATIGYRLSGEAQWPAQIHDCKAAIRWIKAHAREHNLNPDKIAVIGASAGGHLVSMLGTTADNGELNGDLGPHGDQSAAVTCVVNYFGPSELLTMNDFPSEIDHDAPRSPESLLIGGPIQENKQLAEQASPLTHVSDGDAPHLNIHGTLDPLVPFNQSKVYHARLKEQGVESILITVVSGKHGGFGNPQIDRRVDQFLSRHLLGAEVQLTDSELSNAGR